MDTRDVDFMKIALLEAQKAADAGEPPIGAVLVREGEVLVAAHNHREREYDITSHAELEVLRAAGKIKKDWRMNDCTLYVTLEPCPMCAGAILAARVGARGLCRQGSRGGRDGQCAQSAAFSAGRAPRGRGWRAFGGSARYAAGIF